MKTRRQILQTAATAATFPILNAQHSHSDTTPAVTPKPRVLTPAELEHLARLVDLIIPRSDTPSASDARVHHFIDRELDLRRLAADYRNGWQSLDALAKQTQGAPFALLDTAKQTTVLHAADSQPGSEAGRFFTWMKNLTIDGYYTSKEGLVQELEWKGNTYLAEFKGCTHPEHQG